MQIKPMIYEILTAPQRVIAVIEAQARGDEAEVDRLANSCPKKTYRMNDTAFVKTLQGLMYMALRVECMTNAQLLALVAAVYFEKDEDLEQLLQNLADIQAAWEETLKTIGITQESMRKVAGLESPAIEMLSELLPEPRPEKVAKLAANFKACIH